MAGESIINRFPYLEDRNMLRVGYIGLGLMGKSIARNILKAGFPLVVFNRSQAAVDELVAEGASPAEFARRGGRAGGGDLHKPAGQPGRGESGAGRKRHPGRGAGGSGLCRQFDHPAGAGAQPGSQAGARRASRAWMHRSRVGTSGRATGRWPSWWAGRQKPWKRSSRSSR